MSQAEGLSIQNEDGKQYPRWALGNASKNVRLWFSPSDSYIQIENIQQPLVCGKDSQLGLLYSTPNDTNLNFYIMVSYKTNILDFIIHVEPMFTNKNMAQALLTLQIIVSSVSCLDMNYNFTTDNEILVDH